MASRYLFDYMVGNDWRIVGPNVPVLEKSERQGDRYLRWFHDETGTVPQMFHNFYSLGWDAHRQAMLRFTGSESEADAAVRNRYGIAHWGILYDGRHKIPVPLDDLEPDDVERFAWYRPAYGDEVRCSWLCNTLLHAFLPFNAIAERALSQGMPETVRVFPDRQAMDAYFIEREQRMNGFEKMCGQIAALAKELALRENLTSFFRVID